VAYPESTIFYHGVRQTLATPVTVEFGSALTERLKISNDQSAMALARKTEWRFMFRFVMMTPEFTTLRQTTNRPSLTPLDSFIELISQNLSWYANELVKRARERHGRYHKLLDGALAAAYKNKVLLKPQQRPAQVESAIIKKIIDFEVRAHKNEPDWSFRTGGLARLNDDYFLLNEYISSSQSDHFKKLCKRWGPFALTPQETEGIMALPDDAAREEARLEKARRYFQPVWAFLVALCHALQEGEENYLTALDAYWLGLIDEVIGFPELKSMRLLSEFHPDPPNDMPPETAAA